MRGSRRRASSLIDLLLSSPIIDLDSDSTTCTWTAHAGGMHALAAVPGRGGRAVDGARAAARRLAAGLARAAARPGRGSGRDRSSSPRHPGRRRRSSGQAGRPAARQAAGGWNRTTRRRAPSTAARFGPVRPAEISGRVVLRYRRGRRRWHCAGRDRRSAPGQAGWTCPRPCQWDPPREPGRRPVPRSGQCGESGRVRPRPAPSRPPSRSRRQPAARPGPSSPAWQPDRLGPEVDHQARRRRRSPCPTRTGSLFVALQLGAGTAAPELQ